MYAFAEATELLTERQICKLSSDNLTTPMFKDVSTNPGRSMHIACTPFGIKFNAVISLSMDALSKAYASVIPAFAITRLAFGSAAAYSDLISALKSANSFSTTARSSGLIKSVKPASFGITFSFTPPVRVMTSKSHTFFKAMKKRPVNALAFARPLLISIPECPPKMPWN